jgi:hypothetical protein
MTMFPDPGWSPWPGTQVGQTAVETWAEGVLPAGEEVTLIAWGYATFVPAPFGEPLDIYPVPRTLKDFYLLPVWPGALLSIKAVKIDVPSEQPDILRYSVTIHNEGPRDGAYRLFAILNEITLWGSYIPADY